MTYPAKVRKKAAQLHEAGRNFRQIAKDLGVTEYSVRFWICPSASQRRRLMARGKPRDHSRWRFRDPRGEAAILFAVAHNLGGIEEVRRLIEISAGDYLKLGELPHSQVAKAVAFRKAVLRHFDQICSVPPRRIPLCLDLRVYDRHPAKALTWYVIPQRRS